MTNDPRPTTIAWFSPLPPTRSGIASYSAELLPLLQREFVIDSYPETSAHDFVWRARQRPYDLIVYQLGNAPYHDYMWAYLARYPGLVVLHDARLHHARARRLLQQQRFDDYRREFAYDQPDAGPDVAEYAIQGLGGSIYYFWPMLRAVIRSARAVAVHSPVVAGQLRKEFPGAAIDAIRMGVPATPVAPASRSAIRRALGFADDSFVFAAFGKVTAEKRIAAILDALGTLAAEGRDAHLLLVGDADGYPALVREIEERGVAERVRVTGHVGEAEVASHLAAADACLCLRWPTALESSASWLRCLAAARATVISDLAHLTDIPLDVAWRVDLIDEEPSLTRAMRRLMDDQDAREALARAGHAYWSEHHALDAMAADYRDLLASAAMRAVPAVPDLPSHFTDDHGDMARRIAEQFGLSPDVLRR
jgi:glycosyltransferase involved in cell wall biosynthesis